MKAIHVIILSAAAGLWLPICGCSKDRMAFELARYVNQGILNISELEQKPLERYASVTGDNYTTDERVYDTLKNFVLPYYGRFVASLHEIHPRSEELKRVHKTYIHGAELIYEGFRMKAAGLENRDAVIIRFANEKIEMGRIKTGQWRKEILALYQAHGVIKKER